MKGDFIQDVEAIRRRAREHIEQGAVTPSYRARRDQVIKLLNDALATEMVCVLRYKLHYFTASGLSSSEAVAEEFLEHANEEQTHADMLSERIAQLGGIPELDPAHFAERSHSQY